MGLSEPCRCRERAERLEQWRREHAEKLKNLKHNLSDLGEMFGIDTEDAIKLLYALQLTSYFSLIIDKEGKKFKVTDLDVNHLYNNASDYHDEERFRDKLLLFLGLKDEDE